MYGFANDSGGNKYFQEFISTSRFLFRFFFFSSFRFFLSFSLFFFLYRLSLLSPFNRCRQSSPSRAEIRRSPAWKSWEPNKTNYHINTGVSSSHYSCVPRDEYPPLVNHTRSWNAFSSDFFENSAAVIYKESRARSLLRWSSNSDSAGIFRFTRMTLYLEDSISLFF